MPSPDSHILLLATGGTIAGRAAPGQRHGYDSAQFGAEDLLAALPPWTGPSVVAEQVAQVDSKDMGPQVWRPLVDRLRAALSDPGVRAIVVTHGTDTLEETAWLLHRLLAPSKPVLLTAAMRPATAVDADGPGNLWDALGLAAEPQDWMRGVRVVLAGRVWHPLGLRKQHPRRVDAFVAGERMPLALIEGPAPRRLAPPPQDDGAGVWAGLALPVEDWPWIERLESHAAQRGAAIAALAAAGVDGLLIAATGDGTLHVEVEGALGALPPDAPPIWRCSRCADGPGDAVVPPWALDSRLLTGLTAVQWRTEAMLATLARRAGTAPA